MSSDRSVILNMIIHFRKSYLEKFFHNNDLDKNVTIAISEIRYNNNELSFH